LKVVRSPCCPREGRDRQPSRREPWCAVRGEGVYPGLLLDHLVEKKLRLCYLFVYSWKVHFQLLKTVQAGVRDGSRSRNKNAGPSQYRKGKRPGNHRAFPFALAAPSAPQAVTLIVHPVPTTAKQALQA
jgi:hypothetical protein